MNGAAAKTWQILLSNNECIRRIWKAVALVSVVSYMNRVRDEKKKWFICPFLSRSRASAFNFISIFINASFLGLFLIALSAFFSLPLYYFKLGKFNYFVHQYWWLRGALIHTCARLESNTYTQVFDRHTLSIVVIHLIGIAKTFIENRKYLFVDNNDVLNVSFQKRFFYLSTFDVRYRKLLEKKNHQLLAETEERLAIDWEYGLCSTIFRFYLLFGQYFHLSRTFDISFFFSSTSTLRTPYRTARAPHRRAIPCFYMVW